MSGSGPQAAQELLSAVREAVAEALTELPSDQGEFTQSAVSGSVVPHRAGLAQRAATRLALRAGGAAGSVGLPGEVSCD